MKQKMHFVKYRHIHLVSQSKRQNGILQSIHLIKEKGKKTHTHKKQKDGKPKTK